MKQSKKQSKKSAPATSVIVDEKIYFNLEFKDIVKSNPGKFIFENCVFRKIDFNELKFNGFVFINCTFSECSFIETLIGSKKNTDVYDMFSICAFFDCLFGAAELSLIDFNHCVFSDVSFVEAVLTEVTFKHTIFHDTNFCVYSDKGESDYEAELNNVTFEECPNMDYHTAQTIIDTDSDDVWYGNESFDGHKVVFSIIKNKKEL